MFLTNSNRYSRLLDEGAAIDMMDPQVDDDVKDQIEELEDDLTTNVDPVDAPTLEDEEIPDATITDVTTESCMIYEGGRNQYYIAMRDILSIQEGAAEEESQESGEEVPPAEAEETAGNIVDKIADANGVDPEDVTVVISADEAAYICEMALTEAKAGKKKGKAKKKLDALTAAIGDLKNKGIKIKKAPKKKTRAKTKTKKRRR